MPFGFPTTEFSKPFWGNNENVTAVAITLTGTASSGGSIQIDIGTAATADGTYTFQNNIATDGTTVTLTNPNKFVRWRGVGVDYTLTELKIQLVGGG